MNRASNAGHSLPMPTALKKQAADACARLRARLDACTPEQARALLFGLFWLSIVGFSFGQAFVVAGPLLCLPPLAFLYWKDWSNTTLARLPARWLFLVLFLAVGVQLFHSQWFSRSWGILSPNLLRGFLLPFIGMECVRTEKDLRRLAGAFFCAAVLQGANGVWQYATGHDLIKNAPLLYGRLTGSFGTYRVGNYMGMILLPACAAGLLLPLRNRGARIALTACLLAPGLFLWVFAQARMGYAALTLGLCAVWLSGRERIAWKPILPVLALFVLLVLFGPSRISLEKALADPRGELWVTAWQTMLHTPWFGTGIGSFVPALQAAGLDLPLNGLEVQHPHNAYLQFLVDGGIVGFAAMTLFLFGMTLWTWRRIRQGLRMEREEAATGTGGGSFWRLALFFWGGWFGYLVVLGGGHDFYRTWFLSTGMTLLGIVLGACVNGPTRRSRS